MKKEKLSDGCPLVDFHVHSRFSVDCETDAEEMVLSAVEKGLKGIVITDHVDFNPLDPGCGKYDYDSAKAEIERLKAAFPQISIGFGAEVDYSRLWRDEVAETVVGRTWDVVVGAVHSVNGIPLELRKAYEGAGIEAAITGYFREVGAMVEDDMFDIVAHVDIIKRYLERLGFRWSRECLLNEAGPAVERIASGGRYLEVNTSGLRQEAAECFPGVELLAVYRNAGGQKLVMGSDAHRSSDVAAGFAEAAAAVVRAGYRGRAVADSLILS
ncbi:MAG: histidinol-phosphatase HisJ family protein [Planctomycetes bacterium]|nr:histidinol-phosphatase HisJ family protein [Planctomycetota bacterium]